MTKLVDIAKKSFVGGESNKLIRTAITGEFINAYIPVTIASYAEIGHHNYPVEYYGILIDMNMAKNTNSPISTDSYTFRLEEIRLGQNRSIFIKPLEKEIEDIFNQTQTALEQNACRKEFNDLSFNYAEKGETLTCSGFLTLRDSDMKEKVLHARVQKIIFKDDYAPVGFNITNIEKVTKQAFANLLKKSERKQIRNITEDHQNTSDQNERYSGKSVLAGFYDDQIIEDLNTEAIVQYKIKRTGALKKEHIRVAHETHRRKGQKIERLLMAPTIIHIGGYDIYSLQDAGFEKSGKSTMEAHFLYSGKLEEGDLLSLIIKNKCESMQSVFGRNNSNIYVVNELGQMQRGIPYIDLPKYLDWSKAVPEKR
ncbi:MAG: hypothetical protein ACP5N3_01700 [Candidatus Nanoarchaeia archaeon]